MRLTVFSTVSVMNRRNQLEATVFRLSVLSVIVLAVSAIAQTPNPIPASSAIAAPVASPAPEVYFLIQRVSVQVPSGIRGIGPGTPVTIVEDRGDVLKVKSDDVEFHVKKDQVTKDAHLASRISQTDAHAQQQTVESIIAQKERLLQQQQLQLAEQSQVKARQDELRTLEAHYRDLQAQEGDLLLKIGQAQQRHPWFNQRGHIYHYDQDQTHSQLPVLQGLLRDVQHEKNAARRRLEEAQRRYEKQGY
jgi:hypothetical protein